METFKIGEDRGERDSHQHHYRHRHHPSSQPAPIITSVMNRSSFGVRCVLAFFFFFFDISQLNRPFISRQSLCFFFHHIFSQLIRNELLICFSVLDCTHQASQIFGLVRISRKQITVTKWVFRNGKIKRKTFGIIHLFMVDLAIWTLPSAYFISYA